MTPFLAIWLWNGAEEVLVRDPGEPPQPGMAGVWASVVHDPGTEGSSSSVIHPSELWPVGMDLAFLGPVTS